MSQRLHHGHSPAWLARTPETLTQCGDAATSAASIDLSRPDRKPGFQIRAFTSTTIAPLVAAYVFAILAGAGVLTGYTRPSAR